MLKTLQSIAKKLATGDCKTAKNLYKAFINKVQQYVVDGLISPEDAQPLIDAAQHALSELPC